MFQGNRKEKLRRQTFLHPIILYFLCGLKEAEYKKDTHLGVFFSGAVEQIRTADLVITNDVLCQLSYNSMMATVNGLEPSTSSVTG